MLPEKAKPVMLLLALACIVNSFFNSDAFKRGAKAGFNIRRLYEDLPCQNREAELRDECRVALGQALVPAKLSCLPFSRDLFVCQNPVEGNSKTSCQKEQQQLSECFQAHLGPYGFSNEEIVRLLFGSQQPPAQRKPSLDVTKEGGEETAGQAKKLDKRDEAREETAANLEDEVPGREGKPKVEVDQGSEKGKHHRGRW